MAYVAITDTATAAVATSGSSQIATSSMDTSQPLGQRLYLLRCTTNTWYAQGPAATTFAYASGNNVTVTAHGYTTGWGPVQLTTTGSLPTGLSTGTNYWIIVVDANTIAFAASRANALAGTAVALSGAGTGTQTLTVFATAGGASCSLAQPAQEVILDGKLGAACAVVEDSSAGKASVVQATWVR